MNSISRKEISVPDTAENSTGMISHRKSWGEQKQRPEGPRCHFAVMNYFTVLARPRETFALRASRAAGDAMEEEEKDIITTCRFYGRVACLNTAPPI